MAKYRVTGQLYYRQGVKTRPGEEVVLPDDEKPVPIWVPLDEAARAAFKRAGFKVPAGAEPPAAVEPAPEPKGKGKSGRPSDESPV